MIENGCQKCDIQSEAIKQYCENDCKKARIARKHGLELVDVCVGCPLNLPLATHNREHINKIMSGELPEPSVATLAEIIGGLDV